jgi:hypothetical protein
MDSHKDEVVRVPINSTTFLSKESIVQCFELERLSIDILNEDFKFGKVKRRGKLSGQFVNKIKKTVEKSKLLTGREIEAALSVIKF